MVRGKIHGKAKRLTAAILSALVLMESGVSGVTASYVYAKEQVKETTGEEAYVYEKTEEVLRAEAAFLANTETKNVTIDPTSIATTHVYKDMDYSFLKDFSYGKSNAALATVTFSSAEELKKSKDVRLVSGKIIKTEGYYESGDSGSAIYEILSEYDMTKEKRNDGAIQLANGLYACIIPDVSIFKCCTC